jgi:hypothetical protein
MLHRRFIRDRITISFSRLRSIGETQEVEVTSGTARGDVKK